jgi:hypothetical protein
LRVAPDPTSTRRKLLIIEIADLDQIHPFALVEPHSPADIATTSRSSHSGRMLSTFDHFRFLDKIRGWWRRSKRHPKLPATPFALAQQQCIGCGHRAFGVTAQFSVSEDTRSNIGGSEISFPDPVALPLTMPSIRRSRRRFVSNPANAPSDRRSS